MELAEKILMELHYLPNLRYVSKFLLYSEIQIEACEHYQKGSYRNRCHIAGANGILRLSVPLLKGKHQQQNIREVKIAYHEPWPSQHWQSIYSAYGNAPFFEHYAEYLYPIFFKKPVFLFDLNLQLLTCILDLLSLNSNLQLTTNYSAKVDPSIKDFRNYISPKKNASQDDSNYKIVKYVQVFEEKHGFLPNLSILDLLFCLGPGANLLLEQSLIRT